ncbi:MAG: glutamine--fructose-6-phosphate transaminase (isomerizing) [Maricaulaceae bacterium]|nr:glutamine--fructose-6-phosphate transaminase (isomerizing) [Maricaulaceae bacterium]
MCGIVGIVGAAPVAERLVDGLKRLEYRGYDSAGVAVAAADGTVQRRRTPGKLKALEDALDAAPVTGMTGIAHTRWATHGVPSETNAHPHRAGRVYVVHNGIIENFRALREEMEAAGRVFETDTDTEAVAHLIDAELEKGADPKTAFETVLKRLQGAFALAVLVEGAPDLILGARRGAPLVAGLGDGEAYLGSDPLALAPMTRRVIYLEEGDYAVIRRGTAEVFDAAGRPAKRPVKLAEVSAALAEKGNHRHFMEKEIHEQPEVVARTLTAYINPLLSAARRDDAVDFAAVSRLLIVACGTAHYAGQVAEYWFERFAGLPVETDIASEFRYREPAVAPGDLALFISQSGETADTLAALRWCKEKGLKTAAVVNTPHSTMAREAGMVFPTLAGAEIGVASTKAFTCQLAALGGLALAAGRTRGVLDEAAEATLAAGLLEAPRDIAEMLTREPQVRRIAHEIAAARTVLYLGRGPYYPLALEGALKLKEISYIHAEGYAAGELKHGPIALIEEGLPVIVCAPRDALFDKTLSSVAEVKARGGRVILLSDAGGLAEAGSAPEDSIELPPASEIAAPFVVAAAVQLLAYHAAVHKGTDVDQPRNLAKSVTVE